MSWIFNSSLDPDAIAGRNQAVEQDFFGGRQNNWDCPFIALLANKSCLIILWAIWHRSFPRSQVDGLGIQFITNAGGVATGHK
jgi:hypothetical protein